MKVIFDWLKKNAALLLGGLAIFVMFACFVSGCNYHKNHHSCPEITTHTVIIHDTLIHCIVDSFPYYVSHTDTIIYSDTIIQPADTAAILKNHFALHVYNRKWYGLDSLTNDSLLYVNIHDTITRNKSIGNKFEYKILRPRTIINNTQDNSIHYTKYIYMGLSVPAKNMEYTEISLLGAFEQLYIGIGYIPLQKGISFKAGMPLFKWQ